MALGLWLCLWLSLAFTRDAAAADDGKKGCTFPKDWEGTWFQLGLPPMQINGTCMSGKGCCVERNGDKHIMMEKQHGETPCYRCVVIYQRHTVVIQFKESLSCMPENSGIDELCNFHSDNLLFSMFRKSPAAPPVECPFNKPPYDFVYSKGVGECSNPVSRIDKCMDSSRLLLRNAACTDVSGTQDLVEELECVATWKDGSNNHLVGRISSELNSRSVSDAELYRCFMYEEVNNFTYVSMTPDASCQGVTSARDGSKVMTLTRRRDTHASCHFPSWIAHHRHWLSLDTTREFIFNKTNTSFHQKVSEDPEASGWAQRAPASLALVGADTAPAYSTGALAAALRGNRSLHTQLAGVCHSVEEVGAQPGQPKHRQAKLVVHITSGCESGYICMLFYERNGHVIELQQSVHHTMNADEACNPQNFNPQTLPYITLTTPSLRPMKCPHLGRYSVSGEVPPRRQKRKAVASSSPAAEPDNAAAENFADCSETSFQSLVIGCHNIETMEFRSQCSREPTSFSCHGSWMEDGKGYLIASASKNKGGKRYCFVYSTEPGPGPVAHGYSSKHGPVAAAHRSSVLRLSSVAESCLRDVLPGHNGTWALNLTSEGQCTEYEIPGADRSGATSIQLSGLLLASLLLVIASLSSLR